MISLMVVIGCPAHPRSRGENRAVGLVLHRGGGSSPLTRGKRFFGALVQNKVRLIPAHAGKTAA